MAPRTPRNAPCPCGSGRKYKKCCLPLHELAERTGHPVTIVWDDDDDLDEVSNRVVDFIQAGDLDGAERACEDLERRYPDTVDCIERRGMLYEARGELKRAAEYLRRITEYQRTHDSADPEFVQHLLEWADRLDPPPPCDPE